MFGEGIEIGGIAPFVEAAALVVMTIGVFQLSSSPLVASVKEEREEEPTEEQR